MMETNKGILSHLNAVNNMIEMSPDLTWVSVSLDPLEVI